MDLHSDEGVDESLLSFSSGLPFEGWQGRSLSPSQCSKVTDIVAACKSPGKIDLLTRFATSTDGLVDDEVRFLVCMVRVPFDCAEC